jgi:quinohemoprotein ethanol dehydrogenase
MSLAKVAVGCAFVVGVAACNKSSGESPPSDPVAQGSAATQASTTQASAAPEPTTPPSDAAKDLAGDGSDGNWAGYGRGFSATHYSPLADINDKNVSQLGLVWSMDLPTGTTHGAPLEVDGVVYITTGYSVIHAIDALTGKELWSYDPNVTAVAGDKLRTAWGLRGFSFWNHKVYAGTQDGRLFALDAATGKVVWSDQTTDGPKDGRYITGAPLVYDGKVLIGHGGADFAAVRGYVTAYDAETGKQLWRFYTVPGDPSKGPDNAASDSVMAMAAKTWKGDWWKYGGGGTVWNAMAYDPELDRVYIGTGNGSPWNQEIRSPGGGDNLFLCSIVALDGKTGKYVWHYQVNPGETWDFNSAMDIELANLTIDGKPRKVLMHAPKNGFFYVIDRENGKLISAEQFANQNWAKKIDVATGRPIEAPGARFPGGKMLIAPGGLGAHSWMPMSYDPKNGLVFLPRQDLAYYYDRTGIVVKEWKAPERLSIANGFAPSDTRQMPPPTPKMLGALIAWDPVTQKKRWEVPMAAAVNGGTAATAGNLVFQGNATGHFVAYAGDTGKVLWDFDAEDGITGQPITFKAGGKQYVTVMTGFGAVAALVGPDSAKFGWQYRDQKRRLLTFAIGGTATLPPAQPPPKLAIIDEPGVQLDPKVVEMGSKAFGSSCLVCHGPGAIAGGAAPDLRASPLALSKDGFKAVVHDGGLVPKGMPKFDELTDDQLEALRTFVRFRAQDALASKANQGDKL